MLVRRAFADVPAASTRDAAHATLDISRLAHFVQRLDTSATLRSFSALPSVLGVVAAIATISPLFRPLRTPIGEPARRTMAKAHAILATHGAGTLGFFTLRNDNDYLFSDDGRAYLAYRVQHGVVVVSGDPVGDPDAGPGAAAR